MELKTIKFEIHKLRGELPCNVKTMCLTPSQASRDSKTTSNFLGALGLNSEPLTQPPERKDESPADWPEFTFVWPRMVGTDQERTDQELEVISYEPVVEYLKTCGFVAHTIANGQFLSDQLLFDVDIYTLRKFDPVKNRGQSVSKIHFCRGRSDIAVLSRDFIGEGQPKIQKRMVKFVIEIKTPQTMGTSKSARPCWREAAIQLVGLNVENSWRSPPVVMSNLKNVHYVVYLARVDETQEAFGFQIITQSCGTFPAAITFANKVAEQASISSHFSRAPTPDSSE